MMLASENAETYGIRPVDGFCGEFDVSCLHEKLGEDGKAGEQPNPDFVLHPEEWVTVQQDVSERSSAECGN
jgi:hypothetical protein